ncbi:unnamed protein product [Protopolystoma xenopodis]|uniref:Uncharacterized protein n=1 Tax=Protopolystoma xenopodis TaxID=117903 RepID=A0A448XJF5_9PLAT|nr:unnamed protein product [Protopolystoma xenopodis]
MCIKMDTERSETAEHIAVTGLTIEWNAKERLASCGESMRKRKISGAVDILFQRDLLNRRSEEKRVSDTFAYWPSRLGDSTNRSKRRRFHSGQQFNNRKRHHQGAAYEEKREEASVVGGIRHGIGQKCTQMVHM